MSRRCLAVTKPSHYQRGQIRSSSSFFSIRRVHASFLTSVHRVVMQAKNIGWPQLNCEIVCVCVCVQSLSPHMQIQWGSYLNWPFSKTLEELFMIWKICVGTKTPPQLVIESILKWLPSPQSGCAFLWGDMDWSEDHSTITCRAFHPESLVDKAQDLKTFSLSSASVCFFLLFYLIFSVRKTLAFDLI